MFDPVLSLNISSIKFESPKSSDNKNLLVFPAGIYTYSIPLLSKTFHGYPLSIMSFLVCISFIIFIGGLVQ